MNVQELGLKIVEVVTELFRIVYWYFEALFRLFVPPPMKSIDGEVILVTGAAGGIGKEICRYIVQCGTNIKLVIWDLQLPALEKLAEELKSTGAAGLEVFPFAVDISSRVNIDDACQKIKDTFGSVTIIFNNAGIAPSGNFLHLTNDQIESTIQVNLMSHLWILRQLLPGMVATNHGRIVNICSLGGLKPIAQALPYFASKFAVNGYTEALKAELAMPQYNFNGIHLSTVYPYFVQTPLIKSLVVDETKRSILPGAFQRFQTPENVARKTVDGMRREYEYIYLPSVIPFTLFLEYLLPLKARKAIDSRNFKVYDFKDAEDRKKYFDTPYLPPSYSNGTAKKEK